MLKILLCVAFSCLAVTTCAASDTEEKSALVELIVDGNTFLHCNLSQDSTVNITWTKDAAAVDFVNSNGKFVRGENNSLAIIKGALEDAGTYACSVGDFSRNNTFYVKSRVKIEKFEKSINAVQGDRLILTCKATSNPPPRITWFKDNVIVNGSHNSTANIKLQDANNVTNSQLVIEQLVENDRAVYRCNAENDINIVNVTIMIRVKDKLAALWPFLGILAEVAVLCTIIFIYEKRRAKQEYDESDTDPNNESKQTPEPKKEDVRQRK